MSYGAGSITRERGRWRLRVPDGAGGHRGAGTYATKAQAERVRDALVLERAQEPLAGEPLREYGERVIERWVRAGLRDIKSTRSRWSSLVARAPFAESALGTLTRAEVRDWVRELPRQLSARGTPLSWQSQKHAFGLLCRVLDEAREDGLIDLNPARGVKLVRRQERVEGWAWLTVDELAAVFALELTDEQRAALTVAVYQGLRQGELAALTWEHVDLEVGWLVVAASWDTGTKSGRVRRIPLLQAAAEALRAWQPVEARRVGLVFPGPRGKRYARGYDWGWGDRRFGDDIPTRAGVERRVRFHDLRHTCAAHLVSGSWGSAWRLREVRDFLGHTSEAVTERYAHLAPDALHARARATSIASEVASAEPPAPTPAANLPRDVSAAAAQVLDFIQRAVRDSNSRPSAPEARGRSRISCTSPAPRQVCGRSAAEVAQAVLEAAGDGRQIAQPELDELAIAVLSEPTALRALQALASGEHALGAALELAGLLAVRPVRSAADG